MSMLKVGLHGVLIEVTLPQFFIYDIITVNEVIWRCQMLLNKNEIKQYAEKGLIIPFNSENNQPSSYDLTLGDHYYVYKKEHQKKAVTTYLNDHECACIPANGICFIITSEEINMPFNLSGELSLAFSLIRKGVMIANQPPIEPGSKGKIVALLHNLSDQDIYVEKGKHIITIKFHVLNELTLDDGYNGQYQGLKLLEEYIKVPVKGALFQLSENFKSTSQRFQNAIPSIISMLTFIVCLFTLYLGIGALINSNNTGKDKPSQVQVSSTIDLSSNISIVDDLVIIKTLDGTKKIIVNMSKGDTVEIDNNH